jgi:N-methylhydantoinase B/oxoprolinase/acetone carboxylase alpha subunit
MADLGEAWRLILGAGRREGPWRGADGVSRAYALAQGSTQSTRRQMMQRADRGGFAGPCGANAEQHQVGNIQRAGSIISTLLGGGEARPRRVDTS